MVNFAKIIEKTVPDLKTVLLSFDAQLEEQLEVQKLILLELRKLNENKPK